MSRDGDQNTAMTFFSSPVLAFCEGFRLKGDSVNVLNIILLAKFTATYIDEEALKKLWSTVMITYFGLVLPTTRGDFPILFTMVLGDLLIAMDKFDREFIAVHLL